MGVWLVWLPIILSTCRSIASTRQAGCAGQAIFAYGHSNQKRFWEKFRRGPYATPPTVLIPESSRARMSAML